MVAEKITFVNRDANSFVEELKQRVSEYFQKRGISSNANVAMVVKSIILLTLMYGSYALILTNYFSVWTMLFLAILMGVCFAGIGFSVAHDALHGAYSSKPAVNKLIGLTFDMLGANGYLWKITHNVIHHTYTNIHGIDEDLTVSPILRLSPKSEWKPFHRFQHWYALLAYSTAILFWAFVKDYKYILQRDLGPYKNIKHPASEVALLILGKLFYYTYMIIIPLLVLDVTWWQFVIGFVAMNLTAGIILGVIFQLAHVVEGTDHPSPNAEGVIENAWTVHEMETSSDFARNNKFLSWYIGGLNYQIEHHLFPKVCSIHYPAISEIVRDLAEKHRIRYNYQPSLIAAIRSHYETLKKLGKYRFVQ
ncbi:acyl-CoA desaturase [bacterium]|nr:MAG: acyl-CoA desaturase [bacterium]